MQQPYHSPLLSAYNTILVTGAAGFIGSNLVSYLATHYPNARILALDCFREAQKEGTQGQLEKPRTLGHFANLELHKNVEILCIDINNSKELRRLDHYGKIDLILHQAAISDTTCTDMKLVMDVNFQAFRRLTRIALKNNASLVYASSAAIYGNTPMPNTVGINEIPESIYAFSKLCMDKENIRLQNEFLEKGLGIVGLRYFNVYGKNEFYKGTTSSMVLQLGLQGLTRRIVRIFEMGEQSRDFVYIDDVIQAVIRAVETIYVVNAVENDKEEASSEAVNNHLDLLKKESFLMTKQIKKQWLEKGAIYNVGYGVSRTFNELVMTLKAELGSFEVEYIRNPYTFFQNHTRADSSCFVPLYRPNFSLEEGVKEYAPYIKEIVSRGLKLS